MSHRISTHIIFFFAAVLGPSCSFADQRDCFAQAKTDEDMIQCDEQLIYPLEAKVNSEFERLERKFKGNQTLDILHLSRNNWNGYRNTQCMFEAGILRQTEAGDKPGHVASESDRVFARCVIRTLNVMIEDLSKL